MPVALVTYVAGFFVVMFVIVVDGGLDPDFGRAFLTGLLWPALLSIYIIKNGWKMLVRAIKA